MRKLIFLVTIILISSCCKKEIWKTSRLTKFEKTLIPYIVDEKINFIDDKGNEVTVLNKKKKNRLKLDHVGPESCQYIEYEIETHNLYFSHIKTTLSFELRSRSDIRSNFDLQIKSNPHERLEVNCKHRLSIENSITDIAIDAFDFKNVLVFKNCYDTNNNNSIVIYSQKNGVEFIKFKDGSWLKLKL